MCSTSPISASIVPGVAEQDLPLGMHLSLTGAELIAARLHAERSELERYISTRRLAGVVADETVDGRSAVVLLSGGLDSSTTLAIAQDLGYRAHAISFRYGQRHAIELDAAAEIARRATVERHV